MSKPMPPAFERSRTMKQEIKDLYDLWLKRPRAMLNFMTNFPPLKAKRMRYRIDFTVRSNSARAVCAEFSARAQTE